MSTPVRLCNGNSEGVLSGGYSNFRHHVIKYPYWLEREDIPPVLDVVASCLRNCGPVTQICVFTLQLCKTDDADLRF